MKSRTSFCLRVRAIKIIVGEEKVKSKSLVWAMILSVSFPETWRDRLAIPAIAAPMFLISGPDLVVETCRGGVIGTFPALNQRTSEGFDSWLSEIEARLGPGEAFAPFGVNL